jgi:hypothetical protein
MESNGSVRFDRKYIYTFTVKKIDEFMDIELAIDGIR